MTITIRATCARFNTEETKTFDTMEQAEAWLLGDEVQADVTEASAVLFDLVPVDVGDVTYSVLSLTNWKRGGALPTGWKFV